MGNVGKKSPSLGDGHNWIELDNVPDWVSKYQDRMYGRYGGGSSSLHNKIFYLWGAKFNIYRFQFVGQGGVERVVARRPKKSEDATDDYVLPFVNVKTKTFPRYD